MGRARARTTSAELSPVGPVLTPVSSTMLAADRRPLERTPVVQQTCTGSASVSLGDTVVWL